MLGPLNVNLTEFGVSPRHGFLPDQLPLTTLSNPYYLSWETTVRRIPSLLKIKGLRSQVDGMAILSTSKLVCDREWQRAYLLLSFMTHAYIWEAGEPSQRLPPQISIPFLKVAALLELPPTATYAAFNLWNFAPTTTNYDLGNIENLRSLHTFTGTKDEEWFYLISVAIEARGASLIPTTLKAMDAVRANDPTVVASALITFATTIREAGQVLKRMHEHCSPDVFYNDIRPFLAGSKNMSVAGLPNGVYYDEGDGAGEWRTYNGGSNAQSSLFQFFDMVLGVEHSPTKGSKSSFLQEMRDYMPGPHRAFLERLESISNIRAYVISSPDALLNEVYNLAVSELGLFRDIHMQIVVRYIVIPSKKSKPPVNQGSNLAVATTGSTKGLHGTGGTELLPFLRQTRDETKETRLE